MGQIRQGDRAGLPPNLLLELHIHPSATAPNLNQSTA